MPKYEPDPQDPMSLMGMEIPAASEEANREMVRCFAQEFAMLGHEARHVMAIFRDPFYAAAFGAWQTLGDQEVRRIVAEALGITDMDELEGAPEARGGRRAREV